MCVCCFCATTASFFFIIIIPPVVLLLIEPATWIVIESCAANVPPYPPGNQPQEPYTKREKQKAR